MPPLQGGKRSSRFRERDYSSVLITGRSLPVHVPQVKKAAPPAIKKATGGKKTGGWFGGAGGAQDLDKWYGEGP